MLTSTIGAARRRRLLGGGVLTAAAVLLLGQAIRQAAPARGTHLPPPPTVELRPRGEGEPTAAPEKVPGDAPDGDFTPFIEEVLADKTEACVDEAIVFEVVARDTRTAAGPLRYRIGGKLGNPVTLSGARPGVLRVPAYALNDAGERDLRVVTVDIHDCGGGFQHVAVQAERSLASDVVRFTARPYFDRAECSSLPRDQARACNAAAEEGDSYTYTWSFGDGTTAVTSTGYAERDYSERTENEVESTFLVRVDVTSQVHGTVHGLTSVVFDNTSFENKILRRTITPQARMSPVAWREGDSYVFDVTFTNRDEATLELDDIDVTLSQCDGDDTKHFRRPARALLESTRIPRGSSTTTLRLALGDAEQGWCGVSFAATGTAGEFRVAAAFGSQVQSPPPIVLDSRTSDPAARRKLDRFVAALRLLGRDPASGPVTVSDEEIRALVLQGRLAAEPPTEP